MKNEPDRMETQRPARQRRQPDPVLWPPEIMRAGAQAATFRPLEKPTRNRVIVETFLGGYYSQSEIARQWGVSMERVRQILRTAKRRGRELAQGGAK